MHGNLIIHGLAVEIILIIWAPHEHLGATADDKVHFRAWLALPHRIVPFRDKSIPETVLNEVVIFITTVGGLHEFEIIMRERLENLDLVKRTCFWRLYLESLNSLSNFCMLHIGRFQFLLCDAVTIQL